MSEITIYTDGSYFREYAVGGWAAIIMTSAGQDRILFGREENTTNNRMEMTAVICALMSLTEIADVAIYSDSQYVLNGLTSWRYGWERNGWKTKDGNDVKNADLWKTLIAEASRHKSITCHWVRGHNGDPMNEAVDKLAKEATGVNLEEVAKKKKQFFKKQFGPSKKFRKRYLNKSK